MKLMTFAFAFSMLLLTAPAHGADEKGDFMMGGGVGGVRCPEFVAVMEKGRSYGIGSLRYVQETQGFTMYLLGFQTGYNMSTPDTYDIFAGFGDHYARLSWIENYCRSNPARRFGDGVLSLARELHPKRQRSGTPG